MGKKFANILETVGNTPVVRINKLATLEKRAVERRLGTLTLDDWNRVRLKVRELLESV